MIKLDSIDKIQNMFETLLNNFNKLLNEIPEIENYDINLTLSNKQSNSNNGEIILEDDVIKNLKLFKQNSKLEMNINSKILSSNIEDIKGIKSYLELDKKSQNKDFFNIKDDDITVRLNDLNNQLEEIDLSVEENISDETFESLQLYLNLIDETKKYEK